MGSSVHSTFVVSLSAVPALSARDAERLLRLISDAERIDGDHVFSPELLVELGELIRADWVSYSELDRVRRRDLFYACRPGEEEGDDGLALYWEIEHLHPTCIRQLDGLLGAVKLSDFVSLRELRRSRVYDLWFRPFGIEHELSVALPSPPWHTKVLMFDRDKGGRDFSERDRLVLNRLYPHLARLLHAARTRRLLRGALAELDRVDDNDPKGVILLGAAGEIEFASPPAVRFLREFFPLETSSRLPAVLVEWLEGGAGQSLTRRRDDRILTVEHASDSLVLVERKEEVRLTARERDVLSWVARGKTNAEIAELLWLAPSTVRKHLENVYAKLGVNTRTAAVARFVGLIDAEAS